MLIAVVLYFDLPPIQIQTEKYENRVTSLTPSIAYTTYPIALISLYIKADKSYRISCIRDGWSETCYSIFIFLSLYLDRR